MQNFDADTWGSFQSIEKMPKNDDGVREPIAQDIRDIELLLDYCDDTSFYFSLQMVLMWTVGDVFKTIYYLISKSPIQFLVCGCIQMGFDVAIFMQYLAYKKEHAPNHLDA